LRNQWQADMRALKAKQELSISYEIILQRLADEIRATGSVEEAKLLDAVHKLRRSRFAKLLYPLGSV